MRALIVDDDQDLRELFADLIAGEGFEVETAKDGVEGVFKFRKAEVPFDFVLSDWNMPRMNGHTMVTEILKLSASHNPRVVIVMASGDSSNKPPAGIKMLAKPFRNADLIALLPKPKQVE